MFYFLLKMQYFSSNGPTLMKGNHPIRDFLSILIFGWQKFWGGHSTPGLPSTYAHALDLTSNKCS